MNKNMEKQSIAIVGGGLVGGLLSVYLARRGYNVSVFDRRPDIREMKIVQGRSINLALSERGWLGLAGAEVTDRVKKVALPMTGRLIHDRAGNVSYQPYGKDGQAIYSVSRGLLNQELLHAAAAYPNVSFFFKHKCTGMNLETNEVSFENEKGEAVHRKFDRVLGTDGAFSAVRHRMQFQDRFNYSQEYLSHGYKELEIPANPDGTHRMRADGLHIWPREEFMMIALPNPDGSFTCTIFMAYDGKEAFNNIKTDEDITAYFERNFPDTIPLMPTLHHDFKHNPTASLIMVKCAPWNVGGKSLILGDAAHAIVPFYGQGMNCGFEDCRVLNELLDEHHDDWDKVMPQFFETRKPAADAILELALRNYIEMRDLTADPRFVLQKKIESRFSAKYPELWVPLYTQVSFTHTPYHEALANGDRQQAIMNEVMKRTDIEQAWDGEEVEQHMLQLVKEKR
jgi:kynurenine 3-monooxygenase